MKRNLCSRLKSITREQDSCFLQRSKIWFFPLFWKKKGGGWLRFKLLGKSNVSSTGGDLLHVSFYLPNYFLTTNVLANDICASGWFFFPKVCKTNGRNSKFFFGKKKVFHFCFFGVKKYCMKNFGVPLKIFSQFVF